MFGFRPPTSGSGPDVSRNRYTVTNCAFIELFSDFKRYTGDTNPQNDPIHAGAASVLLLVSQAILVARKGCC